MATVIDKTENYFIWDLSFIHCSEIQFKYQCKSCSTMMGCQFCQFDPYGKCDCK